jgi:hypothetical protein
MKRPLHQLLRRAWQVLGTDPGSARDADACASKLSQLLLVQNYQSWQRGGKTLPAFADVEFRAFSQNGEDGILLYLFALLGAGGRRVLEICAGAGRECNSANLIINHGWEGLLFDGNPENVRRGRQFFASHPDTFTLPPRFVQHWITRENINSLVKENGFTGGIDLLSLDIDGIDYWLWEALDIVSPRVVVAETQCIWGSTRAVTVPYDPQFRAGFVKHFGIYSGASLPAFVRLAARKGYRFVGVQRLGFNAFFVREDLGRDFLPAADPALCLDVPFVRWAQENLLPLVKDQPWVEV